MFTTAVLGICAFWLISMSLITNTKNLISAILFKVFQFFLGLACVVSFLERIGTLVL